MLESHSALRMGFFVRASFVRCCKTAWATLGAHDEVSCSEDLATGLRKVAHLKDLSGSYVVFTNSCVSAEAKF